MPLYGFDRLVLVGLSHRTAPLELREQVAVAPEKTVQTLRQLVDDGALGECWVLSTCNRTEVVAVSRDAEGTEEFLTGRVFSDALMAAPDSVYRHHGVDALFHLFSVAAGMKSQVLGESEILRQIKQAMDGAREAGTLGRLLEPLLQQALSAGKRIRSETRVGEGTLSVAKAGVELAHKVLGSFEGKTALVVGAGETGMLVARNLRAENIDRLIFANRTVSRAEEAATLFDGEAMGLDGIGATLPEADVIVVSVDAASPVITKKHAKRSRLAHRSLPPVIIDLSVPRGVEPALRKNPDLLVHDLDDLTAIVDRHHREREAEVARAGEIVVGEVHKFLSLRLYDRFKPVVSNLRERFDSIYEEVVGGELVEGSREDELTRKLTRRLLDAALSQIKEGVRNSQSEDVLDHSFRRYLEKP